MKYYGRLSVVALLAVAPLYGFAREKVVPIKYGDMDQWIIRKVHESGIIGGNTKLLYEIGPAQEIDGNKPYKNMGGSPWGTSNVMAKVVGMSKPITPFTGTNEAMDIVPGWRPISRASRFWEW